jgi:hypothetical protein
VAKGSNNGWPKTPCGPNIFKKKHTVRKRQNTLLGKFARETHWRMIGIASMLAVP